MKLLFIVMLICATSYAQETQLSIAYKVNAIFYDSTMDVIRFGEKIYADHPIRFKLDSADKYIKMIYKDSTIHYTVKSKKLTNLWYAGGTIIHWTCYREGSSNECYIHWVYYDRARGEEFFEFVVNENDIITKYSIKTN